MGHDDYNGAMLEMYTKLGKWYFALVISVPLACANYRVVSLHQQ
jgi:hypothetical protein